MPNQAEASCVHENIPLISFMATRAYAGECKGNWFRGDGAQGRNCPRTENMTAHSPRMAPCGHGGYRVTEELKDAPDCYLAGLRALAGRHVSLRPLLQLAEHAPAGESEEERQGKLAEAWNQCRDFGKRRGKPVGGHEARQQCADRSDCGLLA